MAEGIFRAAAAQAGRSAEFEVDSAGVAGWNLGFRPARRSISVAAARGIDISKARGRTIQREDFTRFDYLLAMDRSNLRALDRVRPPDATAEQRLIASFAPHLGLDEIEDPYFGSHQRFERAYDLIEASIQGVLETLRP